MTAQFKGIAHGLGPKNGVTCNIIPRGDGLEASSLDEGFAPTLLPYSGLSVGFEGVDDRYLYFKGDRDGDAFKILVADRAIVPALTAIGAPRSIIDGVAKTTQKRENRRRTRFGIFAALVMVVLASAGLIWWGFGKAVDQAVGLIPTSFESSLGQAAAAEMLANNQVCSDPALLAAINEMGTRLVGSLPTIPYDFKIRVIDTDDVNAFALPGGYLFINRGLIDQADDSHEVAGVLAHEMQHAMLRHGMRNVIRQAGATLLLSALVGDMGGVEQFLIYNAAHLSAMSFSRDQETAADTYGLELMWRAQLDPTGLPRFLKKLAAKEGALGEAVSIMTTHPASRDRVKTLEKRIEQRGRPKIVPFRTDISTLKGQCAPVSITDPDAPL